MQRPSLFEPDEFSVDLRHQRPRVCVRRIVLWDGKKKKIRDVASLTAGLNIIWSEDARPRRGASGTPGHAAGKTVFCRLLRYVLGDELANETRASIVRAFGEARIGAVVEVDGASYSVVRSIEQESLGLVAEGTALDQLAETEELLRWRSGIFLDVLRAVMGGTSDADWRKLLALCTRDQEARFDDVALWRVPSSGREDERHADLLKSTSLFSEVAERAEARRERRAAKRRDEEADLAHRRIVAESMRSNLRRALKVKVAEDEDAALVAAGFLNKAKEQLGVLEREPPPALVSAAETIRVLDLRNRELIAAHARSQAEAEALDARVVEIRSQRLVEQGNLADLQAEAWSDGAATCPTCQQGLKDDAHAQHFRATRERKIVASQANLQDLGSRLKSHESEAVEKRRQGTLQSKEVERTSEDLARLRRQFDLDQRAHAELVASARQNLATAKRHASLVRSQARATTRRRDSEKGPAVEIESASQNRRRRFKRTYDAVVRLLLGGDVRGSVDFVGNRVSANLEHEGEKNKTSVALSVVRVLAFDITCMLLRAEGHAPGPAFLVHDSPREADMSQQVYAAYLIAFQFLEEKFGPFFQVFITTTTPPPDELTDRVRLHLRGAPNEERLFRRAI